MAITKAKAVARTRPNPLRGYARHGPQARSDPGPHFFAGTLPDFVLKSRCLLRWELRMPRFFPSIMPNGHDQTVYLVLDDFGRMGRAYRETAVDEADLESTINDLMSGQYWF
jgi:hypothetical protein